MNTALLIRFLAAACLAGLQASCSSVLLDRMPDVNQYSWIPDRAFTRSEVIKSLGKPATSRTFPRPLSAATLAARGHPAFPRPPLTDRGRPAFQVHIANRTARLRIIDEYVLRGPVLATGSDLLSVVWAKQLAVVTLGLPELYFFPASVS